MTYAVKEIFYTIQGEGAHAGRAAVFCRFAGCNLWSGRAEDRGPSCSAWCDTDFVGGGRFDTAHDLANAVFDAFHKWTCGSWINRLVVLTGGEPLLQVDARLIEELKLCNFEIALETNGTLPVPEGIDWVTVSPKAGRPLVVTRADELKIPFPQDGLHPRDFIEFNTTRWSVQPIDGPDREANTAGAVEFCKRNPRFRLSAQVHKFIGVP